MWLPYWSSELDLEIAPWFPLGVDYQPISMSCLYGSQMKCLVSSCLALGSELLFIASPRLGCVGSLARDNFYRPQGFINLGFMMILGWSLPMERKVAETLNEGLLAGITLCFLWRKGTLVETIRAIAIVSEGPFFEEEQAFLQKFEQNTGSAFFAERFGYHRFSALYEFEDPLQTGISRRLCEMELPETKQVLGPSPEISFPPFVGLALGDA